MAIHGNLGKFATVNWWLQIHSSVEVAVFQKKKSGHLHGAWFLVSA